MSLALVPSASDDDLDDVLHPGTVVGDYRITGIIGQGGMATVYAATHPMLGNQVAIKVISRQLCTSSDAVQRFVQEARTVSQIGHPNIIDVFTCGALPSGRSYFVMERLEGDTLSAALDAADLSFDDKLAIVAQMCDALAAAHKRGIIHRDIKPDNVFLVPLEGGQKLVKLLDFGIAKLTNPDLTETRSATRTGLTMGTPEYISPEQVRGRSVDYRTDLYALGVVIYELMLGRLPFMADNAADLVVKHLRDAPPSPRKLWPGIPPVLERLILGLLAKEVARRPSIADVRAAVQSLRMWPARTSGAMAGSPVESGTETGWSGTLPAEPAEPVASHPSFWRRRPRSMVGLLLLGAVTVALLPRLVGETSGEENTAIADGLTPVAVPAVQPATPAGSAATQPARTAETNPAGAAETNPAAPPPGVLVEPGANSSPGRDHGPGDGRASARPVARSDSKAARARRADRTRVRARPKADDYRIMDPWAGGKR